MFHMIPLVAVQYIQWGLVDISILLCAYFKMRWFSLWKIVSLWFTAIAAQDGHSFLTYGDGDCNWSYATILVSLSFGSTTAFSIIISRSASWCKWCVLTPGVNHLWLWPCGICRMRKLLQSFKADPTKQSSIGTSGSLVKVTLNSSTESSEDYGTYKVSYVWTELSSLCLFFKLTLRAGRYWYYWMWSLSCVFRPMLTPFMRMW